MSMESNAEQSKPPPKRAMDDPDWLRTSSPQQLAEVVELQRSVLESIAKGRPCATILDNLCHLIERIVPHSLASVTLYDAEGDVLTVQSAPSFPTAALPYFERLKPGAGMGSCGNAALCKKPVFVSQVPGDPRWDDLRLAANEFAIGSCWSIPILSTGRHLLGTFAITSQLQRRPERFHEMVLETASYLAGITLENREREGMLRQWARVYQEAAEGMIITDANARIIGVNQSFSRITGYTQEEVRGQSTSILRSNRHDESFYRGMWTRLREQGRWQGEIWNRRKNGEVYLEWLSISRINDNQGGVFNYVAVFSDLGSLRDSQQKLLHMAHHDPLTGLANRLLMNARLEHSLEQARRNPSRLAVMFLDLDRFKKINDSYGHALGDQLLIGVAHRLRRNLRKQDTIARIGGDEFVVILEQLAHPEDAASLAESCLRAFEQPFKIEDVDLLVTPSIGISLFPDHGDDAETLLKGADSAMYEAKQHGRHRYVFQSTSATGEALSQPSAAPGNGPPA